MPALDLKTINDKASLKTITFVVPKKPGKNINIQVPFDCTITEINGTALTAGLTNSKFVLERISEADFNDGLDLWQEILDNTGITFVTGSRIANVGVVNNNIISKGDYLAINVLQVDSDIKSITIQILVNQE